MDKFMEYMKTNKRQELGSQFHDSYYLNYKTDELSNPSIDYVEIKKYTKGKLTGIYIVFADDDIRTVICTHDLQFRICQACGAPFDAGYTDDYGYTYFCTYEEFAADMDERYGSGNWRPEPVGNKEWCYEYRDNADCEWVPEPSYYTEWS